MKDQEITLLDAKFYEDNKNRLLCGLTEEIINAHGGINMGKFLAYKSLNLSLSVQTEYAVDIDEVLVVKDFETLVTGKVNYLDVDTFNIEETEMEFLFLTWMEQGCLCQEHSLVAVKSVVVD